MDSKQIKIRLLVQFSMLSGFAVTVSYTNNLDPSFMYGVVTAMSLASGIVLNTISEPSPTPKKREGQGADKSNGT